jgi:hypothetical protein
MEVKEQKPEVKEQCTSLYNKYKRKREGDKYAGDYKIYKRSSTPKYFQYIYNLHHNIILNKGIRKSSSSALYKRLQSG